MSGREAFESVMRANGVDDFTRYHPDRDYISSTVQVAWAVWQARDAEIAAKDARIAELEAALRDVKDAWGDHIIQPNNLSNADIYDIIEEALR